MRRLCALSLVLLVLPTLGCATSTVLAWDALDQTAGPLGYEEVLHQPGPPVEERIDLALFPGDAVPIEPVPIEPAPTEPAPFELVPVPVDPPPLQEPPPLDEPVGPPVGVKMLYASCGREGRAEQDGVTLMKRSLHWPVYLFFAFPLGFFSTVFGGLTAYDAVRDAMPHELRPFESFPVLPVWMMTLLVVIMADQVTAAVLANSLGEDTVIWEGSDNGDWRRMSASCDGVVLEHRGQAYPLAADGSLDPWQEAFLVRSLLEGGALQVRWRGVSQPVVVPESVRCRWALERGYPSPRRCLQTGAPSRLDIRLSSSVP